MTCCPVTESLPFLSQVEILNITIKRKASTATWAAPGSNDAGLYFFFRNRSAVSYPGIFYDRLRLALAVTGHCSVRVTTVVEMGKRSERVGSKRADAKMPSLRPFYTDAVFRSDFTPSRLPLIVCQRIHPSMHRRHDLYCANRHPHRLWIVHHPFDGDNVSDVRLLDCWLCCCWPTSLRRTYV